MNCKRECEARPGHAEPGSCEAFISQLAELAVLKLPSWMSLPLLETVETKTMEGSGKDTGGYGGKTVTRCAAMGAPNG
eukprot:831928-Pelagomonas_calceolata.AAC.3